MNTADLSPLYRTLVGFDRISNLIDNSLRLDATPGYPPFNIERTGADAFRIELAVAGFGQDDLNIEFKENTLTVQGRKSAADERREFLHRGIAERNFERRFGLADHVRVTEARLENGLLTIDLVRELPETLKPRRIDIGSTRPAAKAKVVDAPTKQVEQVD
jgi:molecular chaperone IbpA